MTSPPKPSAGKFAACQADFEKYRTEELAFSYGHSYECSGYDYGNAWRSGMRWALAHSPEVQGLRAALEYVGHGCMHSRTHCPSREYMQRVAREALAAWREGEK